MGRTATRDKAAKPRRAKHEAQPPDRDLVKAVLSVEANAEPEASTSTAQPFASTSQPPAPAASKKRSGPAKKVGSKRTKDARAKKGADFADKLEARRAGVDVKKEKRDRAKQLWK